MDLSDKGTAGTVAIKVNTNTLRTVNTIGTYIVGPFGSGTTQNIYVADANNASCAATSQSMQYTCPACTSATATYSVVDDCANNQFSIDVNITNLGTATSLNITDGATTLQTVTATGNVTVGPFTNGTNVTLTLVDANNQYCATTSAALTSACPVCTPVAATYTVIEDCYNSVFNVEINTLSLGSSASASVVQKAPII